MTSLRIAIIPALLSEDRSQFQATYQRFMVPLGPLYLASYLSSLDLPLEILVHDQLKEVLKFKPQIVGISCVSENFGFAQELAQKIKAETGAFIVLGGPHITCLPHFLPHCFDLGVIGDGELVLEQIVRAYLKDGKDSKAFQNIPGVVWREGEDVKICPGRQSIQNLDALPPLNRRRWVEHIGVPHLMTTRGCVYRCFFCAEPEIFKSFHQASPAKVVLEIEEILTQFPERNHIRIYDDIFPVNKKRLREIVELIEEKGIHKRVSFSCFVHAKLVDEEVANLLKRMNFVFVQFGAETGSPTLLKKIKPSSQVDLNQRAIDLFYERGIRVGLTFIVGTPEETLSSLSETYQFIEKNKRKLCDVEISPAVALPGTQLWADASKEGLIPPLEKMDWNMFRDTAHLVDFDLQKYIYLAKKVAPLQFKEALKKFHKLIQEIHQIQSTETFLRKQYLAGFLPVSFRAQKSSLQDFI